MTTCCICLWGTIPKLSTLVEDSKDLFTSCSSFATTTTLSSSSPSSSLWDVREEETTGGWEDDEGWWEARRMSIARLFGDGEEVEEVAAKAEEKERALDPSFAGRPPSAAACGVSCIIIGETPLRSRNRAGLLFSLSAYKKSTYRFDPIIPA